MNDLLMHTRGGIWMVRREQRSSAGITMGNRIYCIHISIYFSELLVYTKKVAENVQSVR